MPGIGSELWVGAEAKFCVNADDCCWGEAGGIFGANGGCGEAGGTFGANAANLFDWVVEAVFGANADSLLDGEGAPGE